MPEPTTPAPPTAPEADCGHDAERHGPESGCIECCCPSTTGHGREPAPPSCAGCIACGGPDCIERPEPDAPTELGTSTVTPNETVVGVGALCHCGLGTKTDCATKPWGCGPNGEHACANCEGIDPGSCLMNPGRAATPAPSASRDTMREAIADAIDAVFEQWATGLGETSPQDALAAAVMAVRDGEMQQLRDQLAQVEDLLRIAHDTSNRSEVERARAVRRAAEAEAQLSLIDAMRQANLDAASAAIQRAEAAEATVADYENRTSWETTCGGCARTLDGTYAETVRAEEAEAKVAAVEAELDRIANLSTVTADDGRADAFATGARWTLRMIRTALTAPHGPAGQGDGAGREVERR